MRLSQSDVSEDTSGQYLIDLLGLEGPGINSYLPCVVYDFSFSAEKTKNE